MHFSRSHSSMTETTGEDFSRIFLHCELASCPRILAGESTLATVFQFCHIVTEKTKVHVR